MLRKSILAAAIVLLSASQSFAASRVWITEFSVLTATNSGGSSGQMAALPALAMQSTLDISGGTVKIGTGGIAAAHQCSFPFMKFGVGELDRFFL